MDQANAKAGAKQFYKYENGEKKYFDLDSQNYKTVPGSDAFIILEGFRQNTPIIKNSECAVHDIGDGVMCLEFQSKSNSIGEGIGKAIAESIDMAENEGWNGIVIGNNAKQFSVGANLMNIGMFAMQKQFDTLDQMVADFQSINMRIRTSKIPVVVATQGYVLGGCEITMHCDAVSASESYVWTRRSRGRPHPWRWRNQRICPQVSDGFYEGDVQMPMLIDHFKSIATAAVSTSASKLSICIIFWKIVIPFPTTSKETLAWRKRKYCSLPKIISTTTETRYEVLGRSGLGVLYSAINEYRLGKFMSEYDEVIARKLAYAMCGGDLTSPQKVSEQYLLDIEREAFMSACWEIKNLG